MQYITAEELLFFHFKVIDDFGGSHGVRDEGRLESVLVVPKQIVFDQELYRSVHEKSAVYLRNIIADHPFVDGNKRSAVTCAVIFLKRNGAGLSATTKELEDIAVQVAVEHLEIRVISAWLKAHSKLLI